jgi:hypothetical protein
MMRVRKSFQASLLVAGLLASMPAALAAAQKGRFERPVDLPFSYIYEASFEDVWAAAVHVLDIYSIIEASRDSGLLKTSVTPYTHNQGLYDHPDQSDRLDEVRYSINVKLSKGLGAQSGNSAVRVQVTKVMERYRNLLTEWERIPTDTFEEKVILYRIRQRLRIIKEIRRAKAKVQDTGQVTK